MLFLIPYVYSTIFVTDMLGNTRIVDVYDYLLVYVDIEILYPEDCQGDNDDCDDWSFGFGRDNIVPFRDYRGSYFDM